MSTVAVVQRAAGVDADANVGRNAVVLVEGSLHRH
jgi:hypothetical protein